MKRDHAVLKPSMDLIPTTVGQYESDVRLYSRTFPAVFHSGDGSYLIDVGGRRWLDFLCGAGSLNYGHNHPVLKDALLAYIDRNGVVNALDLWTTAKEAFLTALNDIVLFPRRLEFRCQFCGPTGADAVEAALKLARKLTGRSNIVAFSNAYHGMSEGAMNASACHMSHRDRYRLVDGVTRMPFEGFTELGTELAFIRKLLTAKGAGIAPPAAFLFELIQCEGGVNIASTRWVDELFLLAKELGAIVIIDEIQSGCGRTGKFFAFEHYNVVPDIVCLSKSISGLGLPMSILLIRPPLDQWDPGEHTGTFRGFSYAYVTAAACLEHFWASASFRKELDDRSHQFRSELTTLHTAAFGDVSSVRSIGLIAGVTLASHSCAAAVQRTCWDNGLIIETCGPDRATIKLLPPLTVTSPELSLAFDIVRDAISDG